MQPLSDLAHVAHSSGQCSARCGCQQAVWNIVQIFPEHVCLERVAVHLFDLQAPARAQAGRQKVFKEEMHFSDRF